MATTVEAPAAARTEASATTTRGFYRAGAIAGFVGGGLAIITNALHPRNFGDTTQDLLRMITDFGPWRIVHLGILMSAFFGIFALVAIFRSIADGPSPWAWPALGIALASAAVAMVSFSIDGFALAGLAADWSAATGATRAGILTAAQGLQNFDGALFMLNIMTLFGLTPLVGGVALWQDGRVYPRWLSGLGIVGGLFGMASGISQ
ncbi:MAG TPA: hypothetical protein VF660_11520, partial [Actinomycetota bacterium]